jgi:hypothetical protein
VLRPSRRIDAAHGIGQYKTASPKVGVDAGRSGAHEAIGERDTQEPRAEMFDDRDAGESGHEHTRLERLDHRQGCWLLGQLPVRKEFVVVKRAPLLDQARCGPVLGRSL